MSRIDSAAAAAAAAAATAAAATAVGDVVVFLANRIRRLLAVSNALAAVLIRISARAQARAACTYPRISDGWLTIGACLRAQVWIKLL